MAKESVSIFYPCYQDWGTMGTMVLLTIRIADQLQLDYELTLVDDGSGEQTVAVLDEIEKRFPQVRVIRHEKNRGYGGALRTGFASANKEWIFYTDGDAQYDVRELARLMEKIGPDVDIVQGYKIHRNDPLHRIIIGRIYHWVVKTLFGLPVRDTDCDFRLMRRTIFDRIELVHNSGVICAEMMTKMSRCGFRFAEVPVHHYERSHGKSQFFNFPRLFRTALGLGRLWYNEVVLYRLRGGKDAKP